MNSDAVNIVVKRPWQTGQSIFLLGPGGVGKSTLGRQLSLRLQCPLIDLDTQFCDRIQMIGEFILLHGYSQYRENNLILAKQLFEEAAHPVIFVMSSGFLSAEKDTQDYVQSRDLVSHGYGIVVLPTIDIELATAVVVERQLKRGFNLRRESEERKFRDRFPQYISEGDALVTSVADSSDIAEAIIEVIFKPFNCL